MGKEKVACAYSGILFSLKKKEIVQYAKNLLRELSKRVKFTESKSGMSVARDCG